MQSAVTELLRKTQKRAEFLSELDAVLRDDPALAKALYVALAVQFGGATLVETTNGQTHLYRGRGRRRKKASGRVEQVIQALKEKPWMTTPELRSATGLSKVQLGAVLQEYESRFEYRRDPEFARRFQWRVKE